MVNRYIPFVEVENSNFQDILKSINSSINDYLVRLGNTMSRPNLDQPSAAIYARTKEKRSRNLLDR